VFFFLYLLIKFNIFFHIFYLFRLKIAKILGYSSHASYQLENRMAENPENVLKFLEDLKEKTKPAYNKQLKEFLELKKKDKDEVKEPFDNKLNYWDLDYYSR